jgi:hypothetical protein
MKNALTSPENRLNKQKCRLHSPERRLHKRKCRLHKQKRRLHTPEYVLTDIKGRLRRHFAVCTHTNGICTRTSNGKSHVGKNSPALIYYSSCFFAPRPRGRRDFDETQGQSQGF